MVILARWAGDPPAAARAARTLPSARSNCSTRSPATIAPSGPCAVWPARYTGVPAGATTAWLKPDGGASSGGFTRSMGEKAATVKVEEFTDVRYWVDGAVATV